MAKKTLACLSPVGIQPAFMRHGELALGCSCTQLTIPHWSGAIFGALAAAELPLLGVTDCGSNDALMSTQDILPRSASKPCQMADGRPATARQKAGEK
jgi:hypothetical protein